MSGEIVFCVTGWHFQKEFYSRLLQTTDADIYILTHRSRREVPDFLGQLFSPGRILFRPNIGYDWGCYQQFLKTGLWKTYRYTFFIHDDVDIKDGGFVDKSLELLNHHAVIGNGKGEGRVSRTAAGEHPYAYAHSHWKPQSRDFTHRTVRGSFLATTREALEAVESFEVFWDPFHIFIGFGNWSTKATCGKWQDRLGEDCFGYLSETFGSSAYLEEYVRGRGDGQIELPTGMRLLIYRFIKRLGRVFVEIYWQEKFQRHASIWMAILKPLLGIFAGKLP